MDQQVVSHLTLINRNGYLYYIQTFYYYCFQEITIEDANRLVGSLKSLYTGLILKGYYLPKYESACIVSQYLFKVACKKVFFCKSADIKVAFLVQQASKIDLYRELFQIIGQETDLGFTSEKLPDRQWLINILYHVSPNHPYFRQPSQKLLHGLTQSDLQKLKELNTTLFRSKRLRFFKCQPELKIQRQANQIKAKITKIKTQMEEDMKKQTNRVGKLEQLKMTLKDILPSKAQSQANTQNQHAFQQNFEIFEEHQSQ